MITVTRFLKKTKRSSQGHQNGRHHQSNGTLMILKETDTCIHAYLHYIYIARRRTYIYILQNIYFKTFKKITKIARFFFFFQTKLINKNFKFVRLILERYLSYLSNLFKIKMLPNTKIFITFEIFF